MCMSLCSDSVKRGLSHWIPQPSTSLYQLDWMSVFTSGASHWPEVLNFSFCTSFCKRKPTEVSDSRPGLSDSIAQEAEISHNYHMIIISMAVIVVYVNVRWITVVIFLITLDAWSQTYRTSNRKFVTSEEVGPASLPVHDAARPTCGHTQALAGQLHLTILTFGHVDSTQQWLNDGPTARSVS